MQGVYDAGTGIRDEDRDKIFKLTNFTTAGTNREHYLDGDCTRQG